MNETDREKAVRRELIDSVVAQPFTSWAATATAEPIVFPAPRDLIAADMVEDTAQQILAEYPYRTLIDCRQLAARLVDEILCWDAMWPEAEGDCSCTGPSHRFGCVWDPGAETL